MKTRSAKKRPSATSGAKKSKSPAGKGAAKATRTAKPPKTAPKGGRKPKLAKKAGRDAAATTRKARKGSTSRPGASKATKKAVAKPTTSTHTGREHHDHEHHDHDDHEHHDGCDHDHDHDHEHHHVHPTVRPQPLIAVSDVAKSSAWYATVLGGERLGGDTHDNVYDRVLSEGELVVQLHAWDEEEHPNLEKTGTNAVGHGVLLWFEVDDFDAAVARARAIGAQIVQEPHVNPAAEHREIWLRDPDGYIVVVASPDGEAPSDE